MEEKRYDPYAEVTISASDMREFHQRAPEALRRNSAAFYRAELSKGIQILLLGVVPIIGVAGIGWPVDNWLLFMLFHLWAGILFDAIKYLFLKKHIEQFVKMRFEDQFVWVIVEALSQNKRKVPKAHLRGSYLPLKGLVFDLVFGTVSTTLIIFHSIETNDSMLKAIYDPGFILVTSAVILMKLILTILEVVQNKPHDESGANVQILLGLRGAAMFMLLFLLVSSLTEAGTNLIPFYCFNGFIVLIAVMNFIGLQGMRQSANWLRFYLENQQQ